MYATGRQCIVVLASLALLSSLANATPASVNASLLWGPYRPNLYVGIRPRIPQSLLFGLMWAEGADVDQNTDTLRHTCEQYEGMAGYGWEIFDARLGGRHVVHDTRNHLDLTTWFVKNEQRQHDWSLRVKGVPRADAKPDQKMTVVFYMGIEDPLAVAECMKMPGLHSTEAGAVCQGTSTDFSGFRLNLLANKQQHDKSGAVEITSLNVDPTIIWQAKSLLLQHIKAEFSDNDAGKALYDTYNLHFIRQNFEGGFEFDIVFSSNGSLHNTDTVAISRDIEASQGVFEDRFQAVYPPQTPFESVEHREFSQSMLANLLGGIGFFYGTNKVEMSTSNDDYPTSHSPQTVEEQGPSELFTAVPSRPFFPRGFLWDEGFHLQLVLDWDLDLAMEIVVSWFNRMDEDGWIAREQILGPEASSKVPQEFQTQYRNHLNPPTLYFVVQAFVEKLERASAYSGVHSQLLANDGQQGKVLLESLQAKMIRHSTYFRRILAVTSKQTQIPDDKPLNSGFQWRGRTTQHILPSGFDDYPRAQPLHPQDMHIDAMTWVGVMATVLQKTAAYLNDQENHATFTNLESEILHGLDNTHWSSEQQAYCDVTVSAESNNSTHVCHKGYISILPFATGLLKFHHPHLNAILDLIEDPKHLWSTSGIRSLSISDPFYGQGENYWRGPIWVNINYMILQRLYEIAKTDATHATSLQERAGKMYNNLRRNLVATVYRSWVDTGFAWEQYADTNGYGQRTQHFTGWTALIVRIMAMPDLQAELDSSVLIDDEDQLSKLPDEPGLMYNYLYDGDVVGWRFLLVVVTLVMVLSFVLFRRRLVMIWGRRLKS